MADESTPHVTPSDFDQMRVVWKYELVKYLRSKRLIAILAIAGILLSLIYLLPLALDNDYSGTDSDVVLGAVPAVSGIVDLTGYDEALYVGIINRDTIETDTIEVTLDGTSYPSQDGANWVYSKRERTIDGESVNVLIFMQNISGSEVAVTYDWHVSAESFSTGFIGFVNILILLIAVFFAADSLVSEFQNRTGYLVFPNALKRETLFAGKYMASATVGIVVIALYYAVVAVLSLVSASGIDDDFLASFGFALGYIFAALGIGYFISSIMKGSTGAIVLTFFLLLMILPIVDQVSMVAGVKIEGSVTFAASAISYILLDPYPADEMIDIGVMEVHSFYPTPSTAAIVLVVYALVTCILSAVIFKRKQLAG